MKRKISSLLKILLVFTLCAMTVLPVFAAGANTLPDVDQGEWYADFADYVLDRGIMNGMDGLFCPEEFTTREQFAQIMYNIFATEEEKAAAAAGHYKNPFTDVKKEWYFPAVTWANEKHYIGGYGTGKFGIGDSISREQICTILHRVMGKPSASPNYLYQFSDWKDVSDYAVEAVCWASKMDIMQGDENYLLHPQDPARRCEIAKIMDVWCQNVLKLKDYVIDRADYSMDYGNGDRLSQKVDIVRLILKTPECEKINRALKAFCTEKVLGKDFDPGFFGKDQTFYNNFSCTVTHYDGRIISVKRSLYWNMGGVNSHDNKGITFSLETGEKMTMAELTGRENAELDQLIHTAIRNYTASHGNCDPSDGSGFSAETISFFVENGQIMLCIPEGTLGSLMGAGNPIIPLGISIAD